MERRYVVWMDANNNTRLTLINGNASLSGVLTALLGKSQADWLNCVENTLVTNTPVPPGGTYRTIGDAALLTYTDAGGNLTVITLPAPTGSIFLADQETVDVTQIGAINAAVVGTVVTPAGGAVTAFVSGTRSPKKGNLY